MGDVSMGSCVMLPCSKEMVGSEECLREVLLLIREGKRQYPTNPQHKRIGNNRIDSHFPQRLSLRRVIIIIAPAIHQQPLRMQLHVTPHHKPLPISLTPHPATSCTPQPRGTRRAPPPTAHTSATHLASTPPCSPRHSPTPRLPLTTTHNPHRSAGTRDSVPACGGASDNSPRRRSCNKWSARTAPPPRTG